MGGYADWSRSAPSDTDLYHFTDIVNMPKIKELDGLYSTANLREMGPRVLRWWR
jgi:hypothetical protein